ncbi:DUF2460 domain-containing protein [Coralliovum pocilloporae]|uniref:DUF2460 domain-containing protein n=1 Tax=Coralliovum pocilloporae TaxID=3066369 RepID=UPI0033075157
MTDSSSGFHNVRFPISLAFGSSGGPERRTEVITLASGHEERNSRWADSRRRYDAGLAVQTLDDLHMVLDFFEARRGRLHAFRFRDPLDHKSCRPGETISITDQVLGTGDGSTRLFQLTKTYGTGSSAYVRQITKPVAGTVVVAVDGQTVTSDVTIDAGKGEILFAESAVPAAGQVVTAGYEFDVPVRFDADRLEINLAAFNAGDVPAIPLVEVRL